MKDTRASGKRSRKKLTIGQRALLTLFGTSLLAVLEIILRLLPLGTDYLHEDDPFVGFSSVNPLFVPYRDKDGKTRMKTAPYKLRWFNPQDFAAQKERGTFRIFTLGGSTTYGRPYKDATSFSGWLRELLKGTSPASGTRFETINCGGVSYASYRVAVLLEELLVFEPDLFVIYTGHNEFLEERTYGELLNEPSLVFKTRELLSQLKTYRLLSNTYRKVREKDATSSESTPRISGNVLFPEVQTILDRSAGLDFYQRDTVFSKRVFEHFHFNIARMKSLCRRAGVPVVFLEPVDNIKDFTPFKSQGRSDLTDHERERLAESAAQGFQLLVEGKLTEGIERLKEAAAIDTLNAGLFFPLGRALLEVGDTTAGGRYLSKARELDVCPLRAQQPIHTILRRETAGKDDPDMLDLPGLFQQLSPGGLIGKEVLIDHLHPYPEGNLQIALQILGWMNEEGFVQGYYFPGAEELNIIFNKVMKSQPVEYFRHGTVNLAKVLIWAKKFREALTVMDREWENLAGDGEAWYFKGSALLELGNTQLGLEHLQKALYLAPGHIMVLLKLAPLYAMLGQADSAEVLYERGLELYPDNTMLLSDYGMLLSRLGETGKALKLLLRVQRIEPDFPGLANNIGIVYSMAGEHEDARRVFEEALEKTPGDPQVCYNLGNLYAMLGQLEEAEKYFRESIEKAPYNAGARINLGNIYRNTGRPDLAEQQFHRAMAINPSQIAPYINLAGLYQASGRDSLAQRMVQLGLQRFPADPSLKKLNGENKPEPEK